MSEPFKVVPSVPDIPADDVEGRQAFIAQGLAHLRAKGEAGRLQ